MNRVRGTLVAVAAGLAGLVAPGPAGAAPAPAPSDAPPAAPNSVVLPTGERIQLGGAGSNPIVRLGPGGPQVQVLRVAGHTYAIPVEANAPQFDLSMFDVAELARHQDSAEGYVTPASAAVTPMYPMYTLDVHVKPPAGVTPDQNRLFVMNVDDSRKFDNAYAFAGDEQRVSVPKGYYILMDEAVSLPATEGAPVRDWLALTADITVAGDGQTAVVDTSRATASPYPTFVDLPRPATEQTMDITYGITDDRGQLALNLSGERNPGSEDFVQSVRGGRHGKISTIAWAQLLGPSSQSYGYDLAQAHVNAVVGDERIGAPQSRLATVQARYYGDGAGRSLVGVGARTAVLPNLDPGFFDTIDEPAAPGSRTEYVYSPPGTEWVADAQQELPDFSAVIGELTQARAFRAGRTYREDFFRGPLAPGAFSQPGPAAWPFCQACRTATTMQLGVTEFNDSDPSHFGWPFGGSADQADQHLQVRQDGAVIFDDDLAFYGRAPSFDTAAGDHDYQVIGTYDGAADGQVRSTHASTEWDFRSTGADRAVPGGWVCDAEPATQCTVLPMMTVHYAMPTSLTGTMTPGASSFVVTVGHVRAAAATAITGLSFGVAVDGSDVTPQQVRPLGGGRYLVTVVNPAAATGTGMTVVLHATDAAGGSITQTVQTAYTIDGPAR